MWLKKNRFALILCVGLLVGGAYEFWVGSQETVPPVTVSLADFERQPPHNWRVAITGGFFDLKHAVKYQLYRSFLDNHPDTTTYFVPLESSPGQNTVPKVILLIPDWELNQPTGSINSGEIKTEGTFFWEFPRVVRDDFRKNYGSAVEDMRVVRFEKFWGPPGSRTLGLVLMMMAVILFFLILLPKKGR